MSPKRGRRTQAEKPAVVDSPQKNSRKKAAAVADVTEESAKPVTSRRSRSSKKKEEAVPVPDEEDSHDTEVEKPKGRTTRGMKACVALDRLDSLDIEKAKKGQAVKRNARQRKVQEVVESDHDDEVETEEAPKSEEPEQNVKQPKKNTSQKGRRGGSRAKVEEVQEDTIEEPLPEVVEASHDEEKSNTVKSGKKSVPQGRKQKKGKGKTEKDESSEMEETEQDEDEEKEASDDDDDDDERGKSITRNKKKFVVDVSETEKSPSTNRGRRSTRHGSNLASVATTESVQEAETETVEDDSVESTKHKENNKDDDDLHREEDQELETETSEQQVFKEIPKDTDADNEAVSEESSQNESEEKSNCSEKPEVEAMEADANNGAEDLMPDNDFNEGDTKETPREEPKVEIDEKEDKDVCDVDTDGDSSSSISLEKDSRATEGESSEGFEGFGGESITEKKVIRGIVVKKDQKDEVPKLVEEETEMEIDSVGGLGDSDKTSVDHSTTDISEENITHDVPSTAEKVELGGEALDSETTPPGECEAPEESQSRRGRQTRSRRQCIQPDKNESPESENKTEPSADNGNTNPVEKKPQGGRGTRSRRGVVKDEPTKEVEVSVSKSRRGGRGRSTRSRRGAVEKETHDHIEEETTADAPEARLEEKEEKSAPVDSDQKIQEEMTKVEKGDDEKSKAVEPMETSDSVEDIKEHLHDIKQEPRDPIKKEQDDKDSTELLKKEEESGEEMKSEVKIDEITSSSDFEDEEMTESMEESKSQIETTQMKEAAESQSQKTESAEDLKPESKEADNQKKDKPRKSRWDDPRKLEERRKDSSLANEGTATARSSSSVPVKIITTKKEVKPEKEFMTAPSKSDGKNFESVVFITSKLLEKDLKDIAYTGNHTLNVVSEDDLSSESLIALIKKNKENFPKHSLWILVSGIYSVAESVSHPGCHQCNFVLKRLTARMDCGTRIEDTADYLKVVISVFNKMYWKIQEILEPDGIFIVSPPIPLLVSLEESFFNHPGLHRACRLNFSPCTTNRDIQSMHITYNMYCDVWTKNACDLMKSVLPPNTFENFRQLSENRNILAVREIKQIPFNPKHAWTKMMVEMMDIALDTEFPSPGTMLKEKEKKKKLRKGGGFSRAVIIGNIKNTGSLRELTSAFPVSFIDADVDFEGDGFQLLKEEQEKWPPNTICIILTGVSCIAEPVVNGPKCIRASCPAPLPVFVPKNHPDGDSAYQGKSDNEMTSSIVHDAFEFAKNAIDILQDGSALFLAPIMPLQAVWAGKQSKLSHDAVHRMVDGKSVPAFGAGQAEWLNCATSFEEQWIHMTMENLEPDSEVYNLYKAYLNDKPDILQYVTEASDISQEQSFRNVWSQLVFNVLKDFLYCDQKVSEDDDDDDDEEEIKIFPSNYSTLAEEAESWYSESDYSQSASGYWDNSSMQNYNQNRDYSYQNQNQNQDYSYQNQNTQNQNYSYPNQNYQYQGMDPYQGGAWMGGPSWNSGYPPGYNQGPPPPIPPGPPPPPPPSSWGSGPPPPPQWMSGSQMWQSVPPPGPWGNNSNLSQWSTPATSAPPPPPSWTSAPPPPIPNTTPSVQPWQSVPAPPPPQTDTDSKKSEQQQQLPAKTGTNIMIQNVTAEMKIDQAKKLLEIFGEMSYMKWPLDHLNKPAKFLMACYAERDDAEKCARVLNYIKPFGKESEVKLVGLSNTGDKGEAVNAQDMKEITSVQEFMNKVKEENVVKYTEKSNRIVVSNISNLVSRKMIDGLFASLRANRTFMNTDLSSICSEDELHYFVCGNVLNVKMMDGYRFPDKKLKVKLIGPDEDKEFPQTQVLIAKHEIELIMKKYIDSLAEITANKYINKKDVNIYTFKTVRCQNEKNCKNPGLCHDYHVWKDRRRCPILFKYSDEMCPNLDSNGKCPAKDKCSKAHSPLEVPFHLKKFRAHICSVARSKGYCNKTDKICAYLHPGTTEAFFDRQWRDVYVEGLDKSITYFVGAIMNLFKVSKQTCVRVLLITPYQEFVTLLVKSMEALAFSCDQEIQALSEDGKAKKATILVGTPQAVINWMAEEKRSKNVNLDRLKALIIDDGPTVVKFIESHGHNFLIEFAKIKDLNKVITAEKIARQDVMALERLRILNDYKKVYLDDDKQRRGSDRPKLSSPSREKSSSPARRLGGDPRIMSSSSRDTRMDSSSQPYSREREKQTYPSTSREKSYEDDVRYQEHLRREREKEQVLREQEMLLREQSKLQEQIRLEEKLKLEQELMREQQMRHDLKMMQEREEQMRREKQMQLEKEKEELRREKQLQLEKEELKQRNYKKYLAAKEEIKREHEREQKLYLELPEVHPEYEEKYRVFLNQYKTHYPGRDDSDHCKKLWMLFWKELVSSMLETAYKKKRGELDKEYMKAQEEQIDMEEPSAKRKALSDGKGSSKYPRKEESRPGKSSDSMDTTSKHSTQPVPMHSQYNQGVSSHSSRQAISSFSGTTHATTNQLSQTVPKFSIPQAVASISEVCDFLGELSPAVKLVLQKITAVNMDPAQTAKVFNDKDNVMVLKIVAGKMKDLSEKFTSPNKEKLILASYQSLQLLEIPSTMTDIQKKPYHGLDLQKVARATFDKDPAFIVQFIKNALLYEGVANPSQDDISDIFVTITNIHFTMANK